MRKKDFLCILLEEKYDHFMLEKKNKTQEERRKDGVTVFQCRNNTNCLWHRN